MPQELFISSILIHKVRHLQGFRIPIDSEHRKHLILTGKNGSGKTSLLKAIQQALEPSNPSDMQVEIGDATAIKQAIDQKDFLFLYFDANRNKQKQRGPVRREELYFAPVAGPRPIQTDGQYKSDAGIGKLLTQHLINLYFEQLEAGSYKEQQAVERIAQWFANFERSLQDLFEEPSLALKYNRQAKQHELHLGNGLVVDFNALPDGYLSILSILSELIMRSLGKDNVQGLVLIDEIENHLHISLQEKILPLLTSFFPRIQFIVTTHSPFVANSIGNAVAFDLASAGIHLSFHSKEAG